MAGRSYADNIVKVRMLADALNVHISDLSTSIDKETIEALRTLKDTVETLNGEQEQLKADLKSKTAEFNEKYKELTALYARIKKRVKFDIPQEQWKAFGIDDKC